MKEEPLAGWRFTRGRFMRLGAALGVSAAGASVLAACGGGGGSVQPGEEAVQGGLTGNVQGAQEATGGATGAGGQTVEDVQEGTAIAQVADVPVGSAVDFTDEELGEPAVLVHLEDDEFVAYSAVCTHRGCVVGYQDGQLACPCHGSVFDPANGGQPTAGPATAPLPEIPVEVQEGEVFRA